MLGEGPAYDSNGIVCAAEDKLSINFSKKKVKTKLCLNLHYNGDKSYLVVNRSVYKFEAGNRNMFPYSELESVPI